MTFIRRSISVLLLWPCLLWAEASLDSTLQTAMEQRKSAEYSDAVSLLLPVVEENPLWFQGHLELALNYFKLRQYAAARYHLQIVLTDDSLTLKSRDVAGRLLSLIDEAAKVSVVTQSSKRIQHQWMANASIAGGYDDNANIGPDDAELDIGLRFLIPEAVKTSDSYRVLTAGAGYSYRSAKPLSIFGKGIGFSWHNRLNIYDKEYRDLQRYDLAYAAISSGLQFYQSRAWQLYLPIQYVPISYGGERLVDYVEFNPYYSLFFNAHTLSLRMGVTDKSYVRRRDTAKNAMRYRLGLEYRYRLNAAAYVKFSVDLTQNDAELKRLSYDAYKLGMSANYDISKTFSVFAGLSQENFTYKAAEYPFYDDARDETLLKANLGVSATLNEHFISQLLWRYDDKAANHSLHVYDRQRIEWNIGLKY